jgi:outer membrane protein insertion porin family
MRVRVTNDAYIRGYIIMIKNLILVVLFCFSLGFSVQIQDIKVSGNINVSTETIFAALTSKPGEMLSTDNVIDDISRIYELGLFKDTVGAETEIIDDDTVTLLFTVDENPIVNDILFVGLTSFTVEELSASLNTKMGEILNYGDLRLDISALTSFYHDRGYVLMSVKEIAEPKENNTLTIVLREGLIEDIYFKGVVNTKEFVITREMTTQLEDAFNINVLREDMSRIFNTGYFETVNIDPPIPGIDPDHFVVVINMKEKRSGALQLGGGIGSASGFFGFVKLEYTNFLGEGYNVSIKGQWGEKQGTYEIRYFNPWFLSDHTSVGARIWNTTGLFDEGLIIEGQEQNALNTGGELTLGRPISKQIKGNLSLRANRVIPETSFTHNGTTITDYTVRSIGAGLSYDTRDYAFNPSSGEYASFKANTSLELLGATIEFLKYTVKAQKYFPLSKDVALGIRGKYDDATGAIFDPERYFAGGATTVRGYQDGYPFAIGARRAIGNVEVRYNLNASMQLYVFYDFGKVTSGAADVSFEGDTNWRSGKGIGFKVGTPIGPLRFDYAWGDGGTYSDSNLDSSRGVVHFNIENLF